MRDTEERAWRLPATAGLPPARPGPRYASRLPRPAEGFRRAAEQSALRREPGGHVARPHRVNGSGFGCPSGALGPGRRTAFTVMTHAVPADARDCAADVPYPVDEVARSLRTGQGGPVADTGTRRGAGRDQTSPP
ncbi:hypothetical protein [Streptomyces sp. NPDC046870]|uniref:hypothetical protein n=1 Tax=Streptomyces sp. NPDC046870 TaxID=3155135 RepID=UPI003454BE04